MIPESNFADGRSGVSVNSNANANAIWCLFRSGGKPFAIPLDAVVEVISVDRLIRLPLAPPGVLGLYLLRRDLTPIIRLEDTRSSADSAPSAPPPTGEMSVLVASTDSHLWGMIVDQGTTEVDKAPPESSGHGDLSQIRIPGACGWRQRGEVAHLAIDPRAAWQNLRSSIMHWYTQSAAFSPTTVSESA